MSSRNCKALVRLRQIIGDPRANPPIPAIIPVSRSTFYAGIKSGIFPAPEKIGHVSVWNLEEIHAWIDSLKMSDTASDE